MSIEAEVFLVCDGENCERRAETHTSVESMAYLRCNEDGWIEVRGTVDLIDVGANEHLNELTALYTEAIRYFGEVVPEELAASEAPVIGRITPVRVRAEAF